MTALALLIHLRCQGVKFIEDAGKLRVITPKGVTLSDSRKNEIRLQSKEIVQRLHWDGLAPKELYTVFPGTAVVEADGDVGRCARCGGYRWWVSQSSNIKICGSCFPPAKPELVMTWLDSSAKSKAPT
jgi:hypothetical protein